MAAPQSYAIPSPDRPVPGTATQQGKGGWGLLLLVVLAISLTIAAKLVANSEASASPLNARDDPGEPQGTGTSAAVEFDADVYRLFNKHVVLPPSASSSEHQFESVLGEKYFGELAAAKRTASDSAITYAVGDLPDRGGYEVCFSVSTAGISSYDSGNCEDVLIGVHSTSGRMYLYYDDGGTAHKAKYRHSFKMNDFEPQRVEVSAQESSGSLKIYREVVVTPPDRTPDCSDYPTRDRLRYTCLFLGELLPQDLPDTTTTLTDGLPGMLTQARSNYQLVMSEEFEGTPGGAEGDACRNGMTLIDEQIWTYDANPCNNVDGAGTPCENVANGKLSQGISSTCGSDLATRGKFDFKYGYIEYQYSFNLKSERWFTNAATVLGDPRAPEQMILPRYGIGLVSYQDVLSYIPTEIDLIEYVRNESKDITHRYLINSALTDNLTDFPKRIATRLIRFCTHPDFLNVGEIHFTIPDLECSSTSNGGKGSRITVTKGIEWTPSGYRYFLKVHGVSSYRACRHAVGSLVNNRRLLATYQCPETDVVTRTVPATGFILLGPEELRLREQGPGTGWPRVELTSDEILTFMGTHTDNILLEQIAVAHLPLDIGATVWTHSRRLDDNINTEMQFEYFRVYQPKDLYTQMEPVYK